MPEKPKRGARKRRNLAPERGISRQSCGGFQTKRRDRPEPEKEDGERQNDRKRLKPARNHAQKYDGSEKPRTSRRQNLRQRPANFVPRGGPLRSVVGRRAFEKRKVFAAALPVGFFVQMANRKDAGHRFD